MALLSLALVAVQSVKGAEIDLTGHVTTVHDGDTFTLSSGERVRLADMNAPEIGYAGSYEARDCLDLLVYQRTVYLDVDYKYRTDSFGRLVCVVYVDYNSTHYFNVNKALNDGGYTEARNYDNEFNSFIPYLPKAKPDQTTVDGSPSGLASAVVVFGVIVLVILAASKRG